MLAPVDLNVDLKLSPEVEIGSSGWFHINHCVVFRPVRWLQSLHRVQQEWVTIQEVRLAAIHWDLPGLGGAQVEHAVWTPGSPARILRLTEGTLESAVIDAITERCVAWGLDLTQIHQVNRALDVIHENRQPIPFLQIRPEEQTLGAIDVIGSRVVGPDAELFPTVPLHKLPDL